VSSLCIRPATAGDAALIREHIYDLAVYEKSPEQVVITEADILRDGFGPRPLFECLLADWKGQPAGFALFFHNYSTWQGRPGIYLEDLFVKPPLRGLGIGTGLLARVAALALDRNCGRFQWSCLDWNEPSIRFYKGLGATVSEEWLGFRLEGAEAIGKVAQLG